MLIASVTPTIPAAAVPRDAIETVSPNGPPLADADRKRLYLQSEATRWGVDAVRFGTVLEASVAHAFTGVASPERRAVARHAASLHLKDLALATACIDGNDPAWEHFIREHRPGLYRAADALDPGGGARELADALYADLYGVHNPGGTRRSLLVYYHGRSALGTWLRSVLAQRVIDRARSRKRLTSLPDEGLLPAQLVPSVDPGRAGRAATLARVLVAAIASLAERDRSRLACYYREQLTLAQTGRLLGEHEGTASRQLARTRRALRSDVEARLRDAGLSEAAIAECFEAAVADAGPLDIGDLFERKNAEAARST